MRQRSYNNNCPTVLNSLLYSLTVPNGLLHLVFQLTEPTCKPILLLMKLLFSHTSKSANEKER